MKKLKLDKKRIREICLNRFHDVYHESVYDHWTDALEVWLGEMGYEIVKKVPDEAEREANNDPAKRKN